MSLGLDDLIERANELDRRAKAAGMDVREYTKRLGQPPVPAGEQTPTAEQLGRMSLRELNALEATDPGIINRTLRETSEAEEAAKPFSKQQAAKDARERERLDAYQADPAGYQRAHLAKLEAERLARESGAS